MLRRRPLSQRLGLVLFVVAVLSAALTPAKRSRASVDRGQGRLELRVRDAQGKPLLARARIAPGSWHERVRLAQWVDRQVVVAESGASVTLPSGDYRVWISRGPEWSLHEADVRVEGGLTARREATLEHEISLAGWGGADLHVHTQHSFDAAERGGVSSRDLEAEGVAFAAVTDHNAISSLPGSIGAVSGAELTTWEPEFGHFNAFPLRKIPSYRATTPRKLFADLAADPDAFVQVNHPRLDDHIAFFTLGGFDGDRFKHRDFDLNVSGLEVFNGYDIARPSAVEKLLAEWRHWVARGHRLTATGGSDSHGSMGHLPGYPRTYVQTDSAENMARALKQGRAFVTNGPLLDLKVEGKGPGETAHPRHDGSVEVRLTVLAPSFMAVDQAEIWAGDKLVWKQTLAKHEPGKPLKAQLHCRVRVEGARVLHAVVHGGRGIDALVGRARAEPLAFTNPVHLTREKRASAALAMSR
jgi:hypothetical protein